MPTLPAAAIWAAIPSVTPVVGKAIEEYGATKRHSAAVRASRDVAMVAVPVAAATVIGLVVADSRDRHEQLTELRMIERAAVEAGDETAAANARSKIQELTLREGLAQRIVDGVAKSVGSLARALQSQTGVAIMPGQVVQDSPE